MCAADDRGFDSRRVVREHLEDDPSTEGVAEHVSGIDADVVQHSNHVRSESGICVVAVARLVTRAMSPKIWNNHGEFFTQLLDVAKFAPVSAFARPSVDEHERRALTMHVVSNPDAGVVDFRHVAPSIA